MEIIQKYFPELTDTQKEQFMALYDLYTDWNSKINVQDQRDFQKRHYKPVRTPCTSLAGYRQGD